MSKPSPSTATPPGEPPRGAHDPSACHRGPQCPTSAAEPAPTLRPRAVFVQVRGASSDNGSDAEHRCGVTSLSPEQCGHCRPRAYSPPPVNGHRLGAEFLALYPGRCALCPRRIEDGDWIAAVLDDDDAAGYACPHCISGVHA